MIDRSQSSIFEYFLRFTFFTFVRFLHIFALNIFKYLLLFEYSLEIFQIKMSLLAQNIYHIFPCALVYTKDHHAKLYQMLWTNLEENSCHF